MPHRSIHVRFEPEQLDAIEDFRRAQVAIPSKPQAIRDLVEQALAARQAETETDVGVGDEAAASN